MASENEVKPPERSYHHVTTCTSPDRDRKAHFYRSNQDLDRLEEPELNVTDNGRPVHACTQETTTQPLNIVYGEVSFQPVVYYEEEENQEANTERGGDPL